MKTYSGLAGKCCCGCSGTYKVASAHRAAADKARGYAYDDSDVSDRSVRIIVGKINKHIAAGGHADITEQYASVEIGNRWLTAYFAPLEG